MTDKPENKSAAKLGDGGEHEERTLVPLVKLYYGPYEAHGVIRHKRQRLYGLTECLKSKGFDVKWCPTKHYNRLQVFMLGKEIYRVNMTYLRFNMDCDDDKICERVVKKIIEATKRLYSSFNLSRACQMINKSEKTEDEISSLLNTEKSLYPLY